MNLVAIADILEQRSEPVTESGCRIWMGSIAGKGYGHFRYHGKMIYAHRAAWIVAHGSIPSKLCVCHDCDIPPCINADHLFLGTHKDNTQDGMRKGRVNSSEMRRRKSISNKGNKYSAGMKASKETCEKLSTFQKERFASPKERSKMSVAVRKVRSSAESRAKSSMIMTKRYESLEERIKIGMSVKKAWARRRAEATR